MEALPLGTAVAVRELESDWEIVVPNGSLPGMVHAQAPLLEFRQRSRDLAILGRRVDAGPSHLGSAGEDVTAPHDAEHEVSGGQAFVGPGCGGDHSWVPVLVPGLSFSGVPLHDWLATALGSVP
jgi:hypothetical protein